MAAAPAFLAPPAVPAVPALAPLHGKPKALGPREPAFGLIAFCCLAARRLLVRRQVVKYEIRPEIYRIGEPQRSFFYSHWKRLDRTSDIGYTAI